MDMFEVKVYDHDNNLLRRSLIQAFSRDSAYPEAHSVFNNTDGAKTFTLE